MNSYFQYFFTALIVIDSDCTNIDCRIAPKAYDNCRIYKISNPKNVSLEDVIDFIITNIE
jgi:hypothetical protein